MSRILVDVTDLLDVVAGTDELEAQMNREVQRLANEINSALPDYECLLAHLDLRDYLVFTRRGDDKNIKWTFDETARTGK